jgi:hypothetical protein
MCFNCLEKGRLILRAVLLVCCTAANEVPRAAACPLCVGCLLNIPYIMYLKVAEKHQSKKKLPFGSFLGRLYY